jgi:sirohydrochlorin ferrochelatase
VVPLLLAAGFHASVDIPRMLVGVRKVLVSATLGPDPLLAAALMRRLSDAGTPKEDPIVLAAAGSSDDYAVAQVEAVAASLRELRPGPVRTGYLAGDGPPLSETVGELARGGDPVTVATYLLSPGTLADRVAEVGRAAGAHKITSPLGAAPEVITLIRERWLATAPGASSV